MLHLNFKVMKKILLCIIFCIVCFSLLSQDRYIYNDDGEKIYFIENANTKYVKFENIIQNNIRKNINKLSVLTSEIDTISENFYKIKIGTRNISSFHNEIKKWIPYCIQMSLYIQVIQWYNVVSIKYC